MKYQIIGKNLDITQAIESKIVRKLETLEKYFIIKNETPCRVVVSQRSHLYKLEATITTKAGILRGEVAVDDLTSAIDLVVDKIEDQLRKVKTRYDRSHREKLAKTFILDEIKENATNGKDEAVKTKSISLEPMDLEEAIGRMELLGHSFYIYKDIDDDRVSIVYKRNVGGYGLIEVDNK